MGLFGLSKKERDLNTLSEKEIQLKLYGHLRAPHAASHDKGAIASNKPIQPVILGPQVRTFEERKSSQSHTSPTPESNVSQPRPLSALKTVKREEGDDLFTAAVSEPVKQKSFTSDSPRVSKPAQHSALPQIQNPSKVKNNLLSQVLSFVTGVFFPFIFTFLKSALGFIFQLIAALIGWVSSTLLKIDFNNPKMRRIFSWTLGAGILTFLLVGIHVLNFKREIAMKHPKRVSVTKISAKKRKDIIPQQVTAQTLAGDLGAQSQLNRTEKDSASSGPSESAADSSTIDASPEARSLQKGQVIQIATFAALSDAEKLVTKLKQNGWPCFAKPLVRPGGKTYFCVFLGAFKTYQEAEVKLSEFKKKEISKSFQDSFIRSL